MDSSLQRLDACSPETKRHSMPLPELFPTPPYPLVIHMAGDHYKTDSLDWCSRIAGQDPPTFRCHISHVFTVASKLWPGGDRVAHTHNHRRLLSREASSPLGPQPPGDLQPDGLLNLGARVLGWCVVQRVEFRSQYTANHTVPYHHGLFARSCPHRVPREKPARNLEFIFHGWLVQSIVDGFLMKLPTLLNGKAVRKDAYSPCTIQTQDAVITAI